MYLRLLVLVILLRCSVGQDGRSDEFVSACGVRLNTVVRGLCEPYGGSTVEKGTDTDVSAIMPWASRWGREIVCDRRGSSPDCLCCQSFYGPCSPFEIIATFCADPPVYLNKYAVKN